ncbi:xylulokinase [Brachybacterium timonense]|uniref:xylulokinase n=1 Tax=Brachybacterium timonense TaxID=2050896 RepID=UPI000D0B665D|nr:xylulokinase [Brachybacterium timonense]
MAPAVLGIDSSTQSTKAVLVDADTGRVLAERRAAHPDGTEVDPRAWLDAVDDATEGLINQAEAVAVAGQQHGMVLLDEHGDVVRPALLWNDNRSAPQAKDLTAELGGPERTVEQIGSLHVASFTATKMRWVRDEEPQNAARAASVLLPHDYVSAHLAEPGTEPFTDRGDASGTAYFSTAQDAWRPDLAAAAIGHDIALPRLPDAPNQVMGRTGRGAALAAGTGDNMGAALGLSLGPGDVSVSIGTSGVCAMVSDHRPQDASGTVTGFADATGRFLPMTTTINASRILETMRGWLDVDHEELSRLALSSTPGANGVVLLPYFDGERTPNRPDARATMTGMSTSTTRADLARAAVEALLCSLADGIAALEQVTGTQPSRIVLIGGGARSRAVQELAPAVLGRPVTIAPEAEYVALGAARQAAWALSGEAEPPVWQQGGGRLVEAEPTPQVIEAYRALREATA